MRLFDSHSHIQAPEFDADRDAVLERARAAGVVGQLVLGTNLASSQDAIALAEAHDDVFAAAGCHPHDAAAADARSLAQLAELARHPRVAAVGEIGLDFYRNLSPPEAQIQVFRRHLEIAAEVAKPVSIHCREAHDTLLPIIEGWSRRIGGRLADGRPLGVMHYFSEDVALARRYVALGLLISVHTSVTHPKKAVLQAVARELPLDRLVVETDSPYGAPQSHRGRRNEPAYVSEAVATIAALRDEPAERVAEATTENALRLFALQTTAGTEVSRALQGA